MRYSKMSFQSDSLDNLIDQCRNHDRQAQKSIYIMFAKTMYNASLRIVKDRMTAEDIVHDSFISAFTSIAQYKGDVHIAAWLRRIVINRSIDFLRRKRLEFEDMSQFNLADTENEDVQILETYASRISEVKKALLGLPDGYRLVFTLYYLEGYDHEEIARILGIAGSTSRSQLTRARTMLIKSLNI